MKEIRGCFDSLFTVAVLRLAKETEGELVAKLLPAVASGDYSSVAENLAEEFYFSIEDVGMEVVPPYRDLFATLVAQFPGLKEPLRDALADLSPLKDLLPADDAPAVEKE